MQPLFQGMRVLQQLAGNSERMGLELIKLHRLWEPMQTMAMELLELPELLRLELADMKELCVVLLHPTWP